jgi:hypothetical protein
MGLAIALEATGVCTPLDMSGGIRISTIPEVYTQLLLNVLVACAVLSG